MLGTRDGVFPSEASPPLMYCLVVHARIYAAGIDSVYVRNMVGSNLRANPRVFLSSELSGGAEEPECDPGIKPFDEQFPCLDSRDLTALKPLQYTSRHETL